MSEPTHDVVIIGGGHNGLVAATYLAQAGRRVLVLEREPQVGGAAISADAFPGTGAPLALLLPGEPAAGPVAAVAQRERLARGEQ